MSSLFDFSFCALVSIKTICWTGCWTDLLTLNINHQGRVSQIWSLADCLKLCGKKDLQSLALEDLRLCLESLLKSLKGDAPSVDLNGILDDVIREKKERLQ